MWERGPIPGELGEFPGYLLARLGETSRRRFQKALEPEGLHPRHFGVMTMVAAQPGMSQQQLHEKTAIDPSSMVAVIDELEARGLAERRPHPDDRRARAIFLTDDGRGRRSRACASSRRAAARVLRRAHAEERKTLHALLRKLAGSTVRKQPPRRSSAH